MGQYPVSNVPSQPKKTPERRGAAGTTVLARAPKVVAAVVVIAADLLVSSGFLGSPRGNPPADPGVTSCQHGSCQHRSVGPSPLVVSVPTGMPRLLEFTSKACPSCGKMAPLVRKLEHDCTDRDTTLLTVDVDTEHGDRLAARYGISELPTFVTVDTNGEEISRLVGEQPQQRLVVALADVNGVLCTVL
jgi:thiol-disulfide isomerase/thioredoxin